MVTKDDRLNALRNATEQIVDAYASLETAILLGSVREKYAIPKGNFTDLVGDTILRLRQRNAFEESLVSELGLTADVARSIAQELKVLFDKAEGSTRPEANLETKERLDLRPQTPVSAPDLSQAGTPPKPLTRDELMNALGGKRTMAQDIETLRMKQGEKKDGV